MPNLRRNIAIDLGTASILVYLRGKGVVCNEPSVVAMDTYSGRILAVGSEAKKMLGRTPGNVVAKRPLKDGVIADFNSTEKMLKYFIQKSVGKTLIRSNLIICVPSEINQVQRRAVLQAAKMAGAHKTYLIEEPLAAAIGCGLDITDPGAMMIIDIGGGTTDVAVISLGGIVINKSIRVAGDVCDRAISDYIRSRYNMIIGERTAEDIKMKIGSALAYNSDDLYEVKGRNLITGLPMHVFINNKDISTALEKPINEIVDAVAWVLERTPPELAADLYDRGLIMTGGGSLLTGLDKKIQERIGIKVRVADNPIAAVVLGTGKALQWMDKMNSGEMGREHSRRQLIEERERTRFH